MSLLGVLALSAGFSHASSASEAGEARGLPSVLAATTSSAAGASTAAMGSGNNRGRRGSLIAPTAKCPDENDAAGRKRAIKAMFCMTKHARRTSGLKGLRRNRSLNRSASLKAADILRCEAFSHTACGRPFTWWIEKKYARRQCWSAGENIAWGSGSLGSVRQIFKAWMRSPGHRSAILSRDYADIGIGLRAGEFKGRESSRVWVQHFGRRC